MYQDYFHLSRKPFSIAPDPRFLYLSAKHREALAHLMFGLQSDGGFVVVSGEVGTGKTTLLRTVLEQVPDQIDIAFILNPKLTVRELLETLCDELGVPYTRSDGFSVKDYIDRLNKQLLKSHSLGRSTVILIDEAQNLSPAVLEQIRLLTNLETNERKLLRIILLGQPELNDLLERKELRQLAQRVTARYHLDPLNSSDTQAYIAHRSMQAGGGAHLFTRGAARLIYRLCGGIPRLINILADRSLLGTYVEGKTRVTRGIVRKAAREIGGPAATHTRRYLILGGLAMTFFILASAAYYLNSSREPTALPEIVAASPVSAPASSPQTPAETETALNIPNARVNQAADAGMIQPQDAGSASVNDASQSGGNTTPQTPVTKATTTKSVAAATAGRFTLPAGLSPYDSQRLAFKAAFERWHVPFDAEQIPCNYAPRVGLQCLRQSGGWEKLLQLDRPAVLELQDDQNPLYFATISSISKTESVDEVTLVIGAWKQNVSNADLSSIWDGKFVVLWQMPPKYAGSIKQGDKGPTVLWLRQRLAEIHSGRRIDPGSIQNDSFDAELTRQLLAFQESRGLKEDGIAGPLTLLQINSETSSRIPRLAEN